MCSLCSRKPSCRFRLILLDRAGGTTPYGSVGRDRTAGQPTQRDVSFFHGQCSFEPRTACRSIPKQNVTAERLPHRCNQTRKVKPKEQSPWRSGEILQNQGYQPECYGKSTWRGSEFLARCRHPCAQLFRGALWPSIRPFYHIGTASFGAPIKAHRPRLLRGIVLRVQVSHRKHIPCCQRII